MHARSRATAFFFLFSALFFSVTAAGQYILNTPDGRVVQLLPDGTWRYLPKEDASGKEQAGRKPGARYLSRFKRYAVAYDPSEWNCDTSSTGEADSFDATFRSKDGALTASLSDSRLALPLDELEASVREQWRGTGTILSYTPFPDTINGLPGAGYYLELAYGGVTYRYRAFIYSTLKGSLYFVLGTQKEIFDEDRKRIDRLFAGITKL
ncbi:MAG TPA: hypothetical protein VHK69_04225 [Chitinophagaceae bacterium]|jgi:hypothetical protein|nr:hypothetical protein [Chitinophagaceae bacterium]